MRGACERADADLLMLALGELDRGAALRVQAHLLLCPSCRARRRRFEGLAATLAKGFRNPTLGVRFLRVPRAAWASAGVLAALLMVLGGIFAASLAPAQPSAPAPSDHACPLAAKLAVSKKTAWTTNLPAFRCDR